MDKNRLFQTNLHVFWMFQAEWEKWQRICWSYVNQQRCFLESVCLSRNGDQNDGIWNWLSGPLAGHDKGTYYIIVREDARYVYLADGRTKTAAKPKRKKRKHVQFSHKWDEALAAQFADGAAVQDEAIRYFIQKSLQGGI